MFRLVHEMQLLKGQIKHSCVKYTGSIVEMVLFFYILKQPLLAYISTAFIPRGFGNQVYAATICQHQSNKHVLITISKQILGLGIFQRLDQAIPSTAYTACMIHAIFLRKQK